jgi:hypothetical protein
MISNIEKINTHFQNPLCYVEKKCALQEDMVRDLEINANQLEALANREALQSDKSLQSVKSLNPLPMHAYLYKPSTSLGKKIAHQLTQYVTTDIAYLQDTQTLLRSFETQKTFLDKDLCEKWIQTYDEIKNDNGFKERYQYFDWEFLERFNHSAFALQVTSVYHICSPVLSLLIPFFILLIPFFIIKIKGQSITFQEYVGILKILMGNHAMGRLFCDLHKVKMEEKVYIIISAAFYIFSIYQNVLSCIRFHSNMKKIHEYLAMYKESIAICEANAAAFLDLTNGLKTYSPFNEKLKDVVGKLGFYKKKLECMAPYSLASVKSMQQWGQTLECFYQLYDDAELADCLLWSYGFHGYLDCLCGLKTNLDSGVVCFAEFYETKSTKSKKAKANAKKSKKAKNETRFDGLYYPPLVDSEPVRNDVVFKKNVVLTGPNASGKTTILKSCLLNIIFSQQVGCGFYKRAVLTPYDHIHCYLNIPDTSGRDSLFQAEARRCKLILDAIDEGADDDRHFCVFDELYSGTNPEEAVTSGHAFMKYLGKKKNKGVDCLLTTHFYDLCQSLEKAETFDNFCMKTIQDSSKRLVYTYKMEKGISKVKGGVQVLTAMNYPREIIEQTLE